MQSTENPSEQKKLPLFRVILSILSAMFGVQNSKTRERDFSQGNLSIFIITGIIVVACFVLMVIGIVKLVLL